MLGNDLACSLPIYSNIRAARFLEKIMPEKKDINLSSFTQDESKNLVWSIKEASFKAISRYQPIKFLPKNFKLKSLEHDQKYKINFWADPTLLYRSKGFSHIPHITSKVETSCTVLWCKTIIANDFVLSHCSNSFEKLSNTCWGITRINKEERSLKSELARKNLVRHISVIKKVPHDTICQIKQLNELNKAPSLQFNNRDAKVTISLSHDGDYLAHCWIDNVKNISR